MELIKKPFYFIRHGQTDWNVQERVQGQIDVPLNETGRSQAKAAQQLLKNITFSHIFYSPLKRAHETMELATQEFSCPKLASDFFKEHNLGSLQGLYKEEFLKQKKLNIFPLGETVDKFYSRVLQGMNQAFAVEGPILIIGHSGTFLALCHHFQLHNSPRIENCQLVYFDHAADGWKLVLK